MAPATAALLRMRLTVLEVMLHPIHSAVYVALRQTRCLLKKQTNFLVGMFPWQLRSPSQKDKPYIYLNT